MNLTGIKDLIPFLNFLKSHKIWFTLEHWDPESVTVAITLVDVRLEVAFFDDHVEYSVFTGDEAVEDDQNKLFDMLEDFVREPDAPA